MRSFPVHDRLFGGQYEDMSRMETIHQASDVDWIALRPPRLINKPARCGYRIDTKPLANASSITYPDLAATPLDALAREDLRRHALYVAN
jgi:hypothetical protein